MAKESSPHTGHRQRMRARVEQYGLESLEPHEALEYVLYITNTRKDTNGLAHALMDRFGDFAGVLDASEEDLLTVEGVDLRMSKIAGVNVPVLGAVDFEEKDYDLFSSPVWYADGIALLKEVAQAGIESEVYMRRMEVLDHARKKTTQKVNLYEKVQIPGYEAAILKIRRFLEDEENLSKSAQKIVKSKHEQQEPEAV